MAEPRGNLKGLLTLGNQVPSWRRRRTGQGSQHVVLFIAIIEYH